MGLASVVRKGVAVANRVTQDLQPEVKHEVFVSQTGFGVPTFKSAITRRAIVEPRQRLIRMPDGSERWTQHQVTFLGNVAIDARDRLTLPGGKTGPILEIKGFADAERGGSFVTQVWLGDRE